MIEIVLSPGRDRSLRRRHPWVLSGAVSEVRALAGSVEPGALAMLRSAEGEILGYGHYSPASSIRVRMLRFGKEAPDADWIPRRIRQSVERREHPALFGETDALRLVNAEGDGLPGLVVDRYADTLVVKFTSAGMMERRDEVAEALRSATGASCGFERADAVACRREGVEARSGPLWGEAPSARVEIRERDRRYTVDVAAGQKTGFYLDQREARDRVARLAPGRRVLDLFSYTGGFAVAAAAAGAASVRCVDSSAAALEQARAHLEGSSCEASFVKADAFEYIRGESASYELLVLDPPPLARAKRDVSKATRAHKDLLIHALRCAEPGALLLAFSCSHYLDAELYRKVLFGASLDARRPLRILDEWGAPPDHPVAVDHPEGRYLAGFLLQA